MIESDIGRTICSAVKDGDLRKFQALAGLHPKVLEAFEFHPQHNLVELAWSNRNDDVLMHLIVDHGFEVGAGFEPSRKIFEFGVNEFHQTAELLASAALGRASDAQRNLPCYSIRHWALNKGEFSTAITPPQDTSPVFQSLTMSADKVHPEFLRLAASGKLADWVVRRVGDDRYTAIPTAHSARMLEALHQNMEAITASCANLLQGIDAARGTSAKTPRKR